MPRGNKPRFSADPSEERMFTWRVPGKLYDKVVFVCRGMDISINRLLTEVMTVKIEDLYDRMTKPKDPPKG